MNLNLNSVAMSYVDLHLMIDYVGSSEMLLSPEPKAELQTSLIFLGNEQKFNKALFWWSIKETNSDYYVVQGVGVDEISGRKTMYSKDGVKWVILAPSLTEIREKSAFFKGRFTGDPNHSNVYHQ